MLDFDTFKQVDMRVGTLVDVQEFPEARNPAYKLFIDFGELGIKKSSAQVTTLYSPEDLIGKQVIAVVNFPPKQVGPFMSECLVLGAVHDDDTTITLLTTEQKAPNGLRIW